MQTQIPMPIEQIADFCRRWKISEFALFGSVLRPDFKPTSDVDVLVRFVPDSGNSLFDMVQMQDELAEMFARPVDLVSWRAVEDSRNQRRKKAILESARLLYAA